MSKLGRGGVGRGSLAVAAALLCLAAVPSGAHALGFELTAPGARANGRAGASRAGGDSPITMFYNPAELATLGGNNAMIATHVHFTERCFQRSEFSEDMPTDITVDPEVCNDGGPAIIPELALSFELPKGLVLGAGLYAPPAEVRQSKYGEPVGVTIPDGMGGTLPAPTRYMLIESSLFQAFPSISLAYAPSPRFAIGATFGWGFTKIDFTTSAYADVLVQTDARIRSNGNDRFIPRLMVGIHSTPSPDIPLDLGLAFQWTDNIRVTDGSLRIRAYNSVTPSPTDTFSAQATVDGVHITVPQPMQLSFGIHYHSPLDEPADDVGDRMSTDVFDIEADVVVAFNNKVDEFVADLPPGAQLNATLNMLNIPIDLPPDVRLQHHWKTQVGFYLGGDYNVVPGIFALRTGLSVESSGVEHGYEQLDFQPFQRVGFHFGATVRVGHTIDFTLGYAHIFQPDKTVDVDEARLRRAHVPDTAADPEGITNAGTFSAHYNVVALEAAAHF